MLRRRDAVSSSCGSRAMRAGTLRGVRSNGSPWFIGVPYICRGLSRQGDACQEVSCLRINFSQFEEPTGHGRGPLSDPAKARQHGGEIVSPVEAMLELGEARDMLAIDGSVGADNHGPEVSEGSVDPP